MKIKKSPEKIIDYCEELVSWLDWMELFHQQQMPEDNGMIIPEWYIYAQVLIETTKGLFPSFENQDLVYFDHYFNASV